MASRSRESFDASCPLEALASAWRSAPPEPDLAGFVTPEVLAETTRLLALLRFDALERHKRELVWTVEHYRAALPDHLGPGSPAAELLIAMELGLKGTAPEDLKARLDAAEHGTIDRLAARREELEAEAAASVDEHERSAASMPPTEVGVRPGAERDLITSSIDGTVADATDASAITVPNHELVRCLGAGGFGQVWLARHTLTEHYRACKLIPADKALELEGLRRLKRSVPAHPNLFPIEDVGAGDGWLYCLMPLADAASSDHAVLDHTLYKPLTLNLHLKRHGRRSSAEVASIGVDLADAVRHLHAHGVTHGDIKPANIMRLGGKWTLADYGLARDLSSPTGGGYTPGYTPPEGPGGPTADQYALGVVLMELLTGWSAPMLANFGATPIERFNLDADGPRLRDIILRATIENPADRFGSMDEVISALGLVAPGAAPAQDATQTLAAAVPLHIESFTVRHYRYEPATDSLIATGAIGADNPAARVEDDVTVHARFSGSAYFYLLSLDADGRVRPRLPASPTEAPSPAALFDYPSDPAADPDGYLFNLSAGPGVQGFMLLVSEDPLPAWSDWIASRGVPAWSTETLPSEGVILFDGVERTYLSATREPMPRRAALVLDPIDWAEAQRGLAGIRFIAFPVRSHEGK